MSLIAELKRRGFYPVSTDFYMTRETSCLVSGVETSGAYSAYFSSYRNSNDVDRDYNVIE